MRAIVLADEEWVAGTKGTMAGAQFPALQFGCEWGE